MAHEYRVREIALQAGLSEATVDRVLHDRGGVRASTVRQVRQAIEDLERQRGQLRLGGRTFVVDLVVQAPDRFSSLARAALEAALPGLAPATVRARFRLTDDEPVADLVAALDRLRVRGSHGVLLKAPDVPEVAEAGRRLVRAGIPLVTLESDVPASSRSAYVGVDNRAAGATAAYLVGALLGREGGEVVVVRSSEPWRGEDEREMGFRATLRATGPQLRQIDVLDDGRDDRLRAAVADTLRATPSAAAVYCMYLKGGTASAVADAVEDVGREVRAFVVHDLSAEHLALLRRGRVTAVLHHDLEADLRLACQVVLQAHGALPGTVTAAPSPVQVVTPHNLPLTLP